MTSDEAATAGLILAGGLARRMGGGHKMLSRVGGETVLARLIERVRPQVAALAVNVNADPRLFAEFGLPLLADDLPGLPGPLAGVLAGLDWIARERSDLKWLLTVPGDAPFVPPDLAECLHAVRLRQNADMACAASAGRTHPVIAIWPVSLKEALRRALVAEEIRKIDRFTADYNCAIAEWPAQPLDPFFNVNTPEDLAEAERLAATDRLEPTRPPPAARHLPSR
ncbi:MAG: molybdenum cofactor guanylyltransferase MobA [Acetobacteraceae bacterium]